MRTSFFRLRYHLGWQDALRVMWKAETDRFTKLQLSRYQHPLYFRSYKEDYDGFDFILVAEDYKFRLPFEPRTIIDAGANIGLAAVYFANRFPAAQIVSIEPSDFNYPWLLKNTEHYPNVHALQGGLWGYPAHLQLVDHGRGHTSFEVKEVPPDTPGSLQAYSIPQLMQMQGWDSIDLLKLDIEGAEKHVISHGADEWLPRTKFIAVELHDRRTRHTSKAFFEAINRHNFSMEPLRECLLFYNEDLIHMFDPYHTGV
ncbi:MAG: FkbM family methyltransferase [Chitinophagaceae bacterium]|jgi:FkbM family methyltransferase|nr:FkbM family methyltransferase [Chitinophagaceae bacterium]